MKILLDENFPIQLYRRLRSSGYDMAQTMPAIFFGHGNPMNALADNSYTSTSTEEQSFRLCLGISSDRNDIIDTHNIDTHNAEGEGL